jgi:hypothetical protein
MKDFKSSYEMLESIKAFDWRAACLNWLIKREQSYLSKTQKGEIHE